MSDGGGYGSTLCVFDRVADMEFVCSYMCLLYVCGFTAMRGAIEDAHI